MAFAWESRVGRFRDLQSGRFVPERAIRAVVDDIADGASGRMAALTNHLRDGAIALGDWEQAMRREIKLSHLATTEAALGGRQGMRPEDYLTAARQVKEQYQYLRNFAAEIASGQQPLNGRAVARAGLYGQSARAGYEQARAQLAEESDRPLEELNVLHAAESCPQCVSETDRGWVPAGTLSLPGQRSCVANCRCTLSRRRARRRMGAVA